MAVSPLKPELVAECERIRTTDGCDQCCMLFILGLCDGTDYSGEILNEDEQTEISSQMS